MTDLSAAQLAFLQHLVRTDADPRVRWRAQCLVLLSQAPTQRAGAADQRREDQEPDDDGEPAVLRDAASKMEQEHRHCGASRVLSSRDATPSTAERSYRGTVCNHHARRRQPRGG